MERRIKDLAAKVQEREELDQFGERLTRESKADS